MLAFAVGVGFVDAVTEIDIAIAIAIGRTYVVVDSYAALPLFYRHVADPTVYNIIIFT